MVLSDFSLLELNDHHISDYQEIPLIADHRDPFDRFILATAFSENIPVITSDEKFELYKPLVQVIFNKV